MIHRLGHENVVKLASRIYQIQSIIAPHEPHRTVYIDGYPGKELITWISWRVVVDSNRCTPHQSTIKRVSDKNIGLTRAIVARPCDINTVCVRRISSNCRKRADAKI